MKDAVDYISSVLDGCTLLVSDTLNTDLVQRQVFQYERWLPLVLLIEGQAPNFTLKIWRDNKRPDRTLFRAHFEMTIDTILLRAMEYLDKEEESQQEEILSQQEELLRNNHLMDQL